MQLKAEEDSDSVFHLWTISLFQQPQILYTNL